MDRRLFLGTLSATFVGAKLYNPPAELEELLKYEDLVIITGESQKPFIRHNKLIVPPMKTTVSREDIGEIFRACKKINRDWPGIVYVVNKNIVFAHTADVKNSKSEYVSMINKYVKFDFIDDPLKVISVKFEMEKIC